MISHDKRISFITTALTYDDLGACVLEKISPVFNVAKNLFTGGRGTRFRSGKRLRRSYEHKAHKFFEKFRI